MTERAVPSDTLAGSNVGKTGNPIDEKAEKPDRYGEWLADDARIWRVYERLAKLDDDEKVKRWSGGLNNLALFATLFASITTAFIIESQGDLKPDYAELAYRVQNATAHGRVYVEEPFVVPGQARTVNCLWIASLLLSLAAALIAVMGQDWVEMYVDKPVCNPRQWAEIRSFRLNGVRRWYMPGVIATAPVLLHASLFLFGIGLAVFMTSDVVTRNLCIVLCAIIAFLYAVIMFSPVLWSSSPFRSPATMLLRRWFCATIQRKGNDDNTFSKSAARRYMARRIPVIRRWMQNYLLSARATLSRICSSHSPPGFLSRFVTTYRNYTRALYSSGWMDALRLGLYNTFPRRSNTDDALPYSAAVYDTETATFISAPTWIQSFLSWFWITFDPILARAVRWALNRYPMLRTVFGRIIDKYRPDFLNGWSDVSETPLLALLADSLSWLSSASSSPEVTQLVVAGLCDHVIGCQVAEHPNARSLTQKLCQYADGHWDHLSTLDLSRYVILHANTGRRKWPDRVKQRFKEVIDAKTDISQDFLLALVHLTSGLQSEPLDLTPSWFVSDDIDRRLAAFEQLCARIRDRSPITLSTITSTISGPRSYDIGGHMVRTLCVLMNMWRDVLPLDLRPVEQALRAWGNTSKFVQPYYPEIIPHGTEIHQCHSTANRPIDNILHLWIESFSRFAREDVSSRSMRDLALSLARAASDSGIHHTCLVAMLSDTSSHVTKAAWSDLPAPEIQWALDHTCSYISWDKCHTDLRPMLARMIARCIRPPFPLLAGTISAQALVSKGELLFELVDAMSRDRAVPDDLFRPVLEYGALVNLTASMREEPSDTDGDGVSNFLQILMAIALWITAQRDVNDQRRFLELFTVPQTSCASNSAFLNLLDAIGTVLATADMFTESYHFRPPLSGFPGVVEGLMSVMKVLRELFPGPSCTLWADIALQFWANKHRFEPYQWRVFQKLCLNGTGIDPEQFAAEDPSRRAGSAVSGDDSARGSTVQPTNGSIGVITIAHQMPQTAGIEAGEIPHGGP